MCLRVNQIWSSRFQAYNNPPMHEEVKLPVNKVSKYAIISKKAHNIHVCNEQNKYYINEH
jgi:hypothetical protein